MRECVCISQCVCVCVCGREGGKNGGTERETRGEREIERAHEGERGNTCGTHLPKREQISEKVCVRPLPKKSKNPRKNERYNNGATVYNTVSIFICSS